MNANARESRNGIARVFFTVDGKYMILLHGFIKKSQKTPQNELKTAITRLGNYERGKLNYLPMTSYLIPLLMLSVRLVVLVQ